MHDMPTIAIDDPGVCPFVCYVSAVQQRLNGSPSCLDEYSRGPKNIVLDECKVDAAFAKLLWPLC